MQAIPKLFPGEVALINDLGLKWGENPASQVPAPDCSSIRELGDGFVQPSSTGWVLVLQLVQSRETIRFMGLRDKWY